ncbi:MAG: M64 family metallopeptidase [Bacteroidota bacterium]
MRLLFILLGVFLPPSLHALQAVSYERFFTGSALRVDYHHTGTKGAEQISLDRLYREGEWPGSRVNLLDTLNLGEYMVRVYDVSTGALIYSRGFSSMFQEWQTTEDAVRGGWKTFSESVRMPFPRGRVQVSFSRRDRSMIFHEIFTAVVDPQDPALVEKHRGIPPFPVTDLMVHGDPSTHVDILILGDGYTRGEMDLFLRDAARLNDVMFSTEPFRSRKKDFNVRAIQTVSGESGIDIPDRGVWKDNILGCRYNTFGSPRYVLTEENRALRDIASLAPYDFLCILVNDTRYGGGGIYNLYAIGYTREETQAVQWQPDYVYVHEFGHSFGGLGDEYYTSSTSYTDFYVPGVEPWEPNISATAKRDHIKWRGMIAEGTALPTPWQKAAYDSIEQIRQKLDRLAPDYYRKQAPYYRAAMVLLEQSPPAGVVGAFEGAGYMSRGLYRPAVNCRMFSLSLAGFDPVCSAALERVIGFHAR